MPHALLLYIVIKKASHPRIILIISFTYFLPSIRDLLNSVVFLIACIIRTKYDIPHCPYAYYSRTIDITILIYVSSKNRIIPAVCLRYNLKIPFGNLYTNSLILYLVPVNDPYPSSESKTMTSHSS